ncbi:hypothetical protein SAMN06298216_1696 [Spirosomataceae bacterium TFI 002]|nr:hypothetical protein SAMN06298216_1696 [Spirosomataceae bacterium TFI 002]
MIDNKEKGDIGEDFVNQLAYKSYLKYWCYPNPTDICGDKKEICDLLILFRDIAIIISVKNHNFDGNYGRYKRKVIDKSSKQLNGAYRKLFASHRDIFIKHPDREAELFEPQKYSNVYRLTINVGEQFEHYELGDQTDNKGFINILNRDTFEAIISELDTIKDFVEYLDEREQLLLSGKGLNFNCQEKDLLAEFLTNERKFPFDYSSSNIQEFNLNLSGAWGNYINSEPVRRKKEADKASYFIDKLVKTDILKLPDGEVLAKELMYMGRMDRRMLAKKLFRLVAKYENQDDVFARSYSEYNGIGHLLIYYPPNRKETEVDEFIRIAMQIYAYKTNFSEREIIVLAATRGLKQWKFVMFQADPPIPDNVKSYLDKLIEQFGWFKDMKTFYYEEEEYPSES